MWPEWHYLLLVPKVKIGRASIPWIAIAQTNDSSVRLRLSGSRGQIPDQVIDEVYLKAVLIPLDESPTIEKYWQEY